MMLAEIVKHNSKMAYQNVDLESIRKAFITHNLIQNISV